MIGGKVPGIAHTDPRVAVPLYTLHQGSQLLNAVRLRKVILRRGVRPPKIDRVRLTGRQIPRG